MPASQVLSSRWRGHPGGWWNPREWRIASISVPVGSHVARRGWRGADPGFERTCVLCFFGDGATSTGAFHEGMTFASAKRVPAVFVCNNNSWAISTPTAEQSGAERLVDKAAGYGIEGVRVQAAPTPWRCATPYARRLRGREPAKARNSSRRSPSAARPTPPPTTPAAKSTPPS